MHAFWILIVGTFWVALGQCLEYSLLEIKEVRGHKKGIHTMPAFWNFIVGTFWVALGLCPAYSLLAI